MTKDFLKLKINKLIYTEKLHKMLIIKHNVLHFLVIYKN